MIRVLVLVLPLFLIACKGSKDTTTIDKEIESTEKIEAKETTCRLLVSFYSPGNGIDRKIKTKYQQFITAYSKSITYEQTGWGKEGEIDFCFTLSELSMEEQVDFVKQSKDLLSKSSRVHIYENVPSKN